MLQLLEEDDCVVGVQYKDKETGDTKVRQFSVTIFVKLLRKSRVGLYIYIKKNLKPPSISEHWYRNNAIIKKAKALIKRDYFLVDTVPHMGILVITSCAASAFSVSGGFSSLFISIFICLEFKIF